MPTTEPLKRYLEAQRQLDQNPASAAASLEAALGSHEDNPFIRNNLGKLLDPNTLAGDGVLELLRVELRRTLKE